MVRADGTHRRPRADNGAHLPGWGGLDNWSLAVPAEAADWYRRIGANAADAAVKTVA